MSGRLVAIPNVIEWHDGMLLTPQHFEDLTLRLEGLLEYAATVASPFNWGVSTLEIGEAELLDGYFTVTAMQGILPDGCPIWQDAGSAVPLQLSLNSREPQFKSGVFTVYAAVPAGRDSTERSWRFEPCAPTREEQAQAETSDAVPIPRLRPRLQLLASQVPPGSRYSSMPLAKLQFHSGAYARVETYVPPTQKLRLDSPLLGECIGLLRRVREVAITLQQQWRSLSAQERESQDLTQRNAVQQMVSMLPYAEALLEVGEAHPFQVFLMLCTLAGHAASTRADAIPPNFAPYAHTDIHTSFAEVMRYIELVLEENSTEAYLGIPFQYHDDRFSVKFDPGWKGRKLVLAMNAGTSPLEAVVQWGEHALIGAAVLQEGMRDRRVLGARRIHVDHEDGIFRNAETVLFQVANDDHARGGELFEVSSGQPGQAVGRPVKMTLYVMQA